MEFNLFTKYQDIKPKKDNRHEFQIRGKEISDFIKKPCYFLFSKYNHQAIYDSFEDLKKSPPDCHNLDYLIGIIRKKK